MKRYRSRTWIEGAAIIAFAASLIAAANFAVATNTVETPASTAFGTAGFADVVERVSPAVVNISVSKTTLPTPTMGGNMGRMPGPNGQNPFDDFFGRFFDMPGMPGMPQAPHEAQALGSGFIVDPDGYVITNHHVIDGASKITVTLQDERQFDATLVGDDEKTDLALLKIDAEEPFVAVSLGDSDRVRIGDWVLAIGNPFGLGGTATAGIVSARGRDIQSGPYDDYLQIDAPINSGNSGGPVFNGTGEVIGVNTAIYSPSGGNVGIGFAIPSNQVQAVTAELRASGTVKRGWLGVQIQPLDDDLAASLGLDENHGALVAEVVDGSPADKAGILVGDVVTGLNSHEVDSPRTLSRLVGDSDPDEEARLTVWRDGKERTVRVTLGRSDTGALVASRTDGRTAGTELGITLAALTDDVRDATGIPADVDGVLVTSVEPGSPAAEKGITAGDVLLQINGKTYDRVADAAAAIAESTEESHRVMLLTRRGDNQRFVSIRVS